MEDTLIIKVLDAEIELHHETMGEAVSDNNYQQAANAQTAIDAIEALKAKFISL